ncbi:MAG TPA: HAMP domain-containing sensor histidine kinase [Myxococcales bacterium]|nr:HAMP domain-containing sensor histidine kinase [Myxococcales bacterium]
MAESESRAERLSLEALHDKYSELATKYQNLVARVERRATADLAIYRLGNWGLEATSAALAVVDKDHIALANTRFTSLERTMAGPLLCTGPAGRRSYPDLRALAIAEAAPLLRGRRPTGEMRYRDATSGVELLIRLERSRGVRSPTVLIIAEDVTESARRDVELGNAREALVHRERLRVLGELAVSIAHDLGNTLRGTSFQLASLDDPSVTADQRARALRGIAERIEVASLAISRLLDFARTGSLETQAVQLGRIVSQAVGIVHSELREGKPVEIRVSVPELPPVRGSVSELSLLFVNLLRNARQAMPEGGTIFIDARRKGDWAMVTVADEGRGIAPELEARLFEPFFSTKGAQGTGLGLWLAAGTMARLGGSIRGVNRLQGGALFSLRFPLLKVSRRPRPAEGTEAPAGRPSRAPRRRRPAARSGRRP